ncbi:MAG: UDP-N-acetylglucosamine 1-carboxyvinyltransferase, partial [Candidatus Saccharimonadales bacterium]
HLFALEEFGVDITAKDGNYHVGATPKSPGELTLYEAGNTVTNNVMMAAALTPATTKVYGASGDYMTQDLGYFLQKLGIKIEGIGMPFLMITGLRKINKDVTYSPTEDPIEAMFFIAAAAVTNSKITIERVPRHWIGLELLKLEKMGLSISRSKPYLADNGKIELADLTIEKYTRLKALDDKIHPNLWPGINPDSLPYMVIIAALAHGRTLIHDWIFENRAIYYTELAKIGASVELADPHRLYVTGPTHWRTADLVCPPALRPASLLLIGMLAADGISTLRNVYTIRRGYEDLADRLNSLGARISILNTI